MLVVPEDYIQNCVMYECMKNSDTLDLLSCKAFLFCALNWTGVLMATAANCHIPHISFSQKLASILPHTQRTRVVVAIDTHLCELV